MNRSIYEPSHGSVPDISGKGIANPIAAILSVATMFEYAFSRVNIAREIEHVVEQTLTRGIMTPDLGGTSSTAETTTAVLETFCAN
ncbi:MAG: hypothetical protein GY896_14875 [Gammaproteobacteria bacterium]|nr:hypothetical protein [Gammaproteobacteria bacterium]